MIFRKKDENKIPCKAYPSGRLVYDAEAILKSENAQKHLKSGVEYIKGQTMAKKSVKDIVCPPAYQPTEQEHRIAYLEHVLETISYDYLLGIKMYKEDLEEYKKGLGEKRKSYRAGKPIETAEDLEKVIQDEINSFLKHYFGSWNDEGNGEKEAWEVFMDYDEFKRTWGGEYLAEHHCGDCTAVPCPCTRCHAEAKYKQDSVTWNGKHEGSRLLSEYNALMRKEERGKKLRKWWPFKKKGQ